MYDEEDETNEAYDAIEELREEITNLQCLVRDIYQLLDRYIYD